MPEYQYELTKITFAIVSYEIDQYDQKRRDGETIVHASYSSFQEAVEHLDEFTVTWGWQNSRRKPKDATHEYWHSTVERRRVNIIVGNRAEVAIMAMGLIE